MFLTIAAAAAVAVISVFNAAVGNGDDAPREPNNNNNGNNRNRVMNNVFSMRDRVINNNLGPRDWERQGACESVKDDWDRHFRRLLPVVMQRSIEEDPDGEFDDIKNTTCILATACTLGGGAPADLDRQRVRYWNYIFRLRSLGENPAAIFTNMIIDDAEEREAEDEQEVIDLTGDSDDEPEDNDDDSNDDGNDEDDE